MKVGFIGLGQMGLPMASNLIDAGYKTVIYNRTRSKADVLVAKGAEVASSIAEVAQADVVITMLPNDASVTSVANGSDGLVENMPPSVGRQSG